MCIRDRVTVTATNQELLTLFPDNFLLLAKGSCNDFKLKGIVQRHAQVACQTDITHRLLTVFMISEGKFYV